MKAKTQKLKDELRPEYDSDYSKAVRGKYPKRLVEKGANVVVLEDVSNGFSDEQTRSKTACGHDAG